MLDQLFYLLTLQNTYVQVHAIVNKKIDEIVTILENQNVKGTQKLYHEEMLKMIAHFKKNPAKFKRQLVPKIPDGSPIGSE